MLGVCALLLSGCAGSVDAAGTHADRAVPPGSAPAAPDDSFAAMLKLLPPSPAGNIMLSINRYHAAARAQQVPIPGDDASAEDLVTFYGSLQGLTLASDITSPPWIEGGSTEEQFGYRRQAVSADARLGRTPGYQLARGDFDADAITEGMQTGPLAERVEVTEVDGVEVLRWLKDQATDVDLVTSLSPLGRSGRLAIPDDSTLLLAETDELIDNLISRQRGNGPSLADDPAMSSLASVLDDRQALSGDFQSHDGGSTPNVLQYSVSACGSYQDSMLRLVLAFATDSEADASKLADQLRTLMTSAVPDQDLQWSDVLADAQFAASDSTTVVTAAYTRGQLDCDDVLYAIESAAGES